MVTVEEAEKTILSNIRDFGTETVLLQNALGRILAEDIKADRDLPPYNRVSMDGIAISHIAFEKGQRNFQIKATQAAGDSPIDITELGECIEIMTGAALPGTTDTIIRYEDLNIQNQTATINISDIRKGQNVHLKGIDKKAGDLIATAGKIIDPALISIAASVGKTKLGVRELPKVVIITTGDELVASDQTPSDYQIRRSNDFAIKTALAQYHLNADLLHIPDDHAKTVETIKNCLEEYDVIVLSGGVSAGKFDYIAKALEELSVNKLFYQVQQRPGKPFWFGTHANGTLVFAFPGNPVSTFMCLHRYLIPWLQTSLGLGVKKSYALLDTDTTFKPSLKYFLQVKLHMNDQAQLIATPVQGQGSGDFANLADVDAFMELPVERANFSKGEIFRIWPFKTIFI